jgi:hypothetical protein
MKKLGTWWGRKDEEEEGHLMSAYIYRFNIMKMYISHTGCDPWERERHTKR